MHKYLLAAAMISTVFGVSAANAYGGHHGGGRGGFREPCCYGPSLPFVAGVALGEALAGEPRGYYVPRGVIVEEVPPYVERDYYGRPMMPRYRMVCDPYRRYACRPVRIY